MDVDDAATTPFTAKSGTLVIGVIEVAVRVPELVEAPVVNPAVKVPLNLPKLAATGLARVKAAAVAPEAMLEKAAATSLAVMFTLAVKVKPLTVTKSFGLRALNVTTLFSVIDEPPWVVTEILDAAAPVPANVRSAVAPAAAAVSFTSCPPPSVAAV